MKVNIGPYTRWFGPYQAADLLQKVGVSDDRCHIIGKWLSDTWVGTFLAWVDSKKKRKEKIIIHNYDTWNMDDTLAKIILPMLKQLKETKHGSPHVDDEDVPDELKSTSAPPKANSWDTDDLWHDRWNWVMDQMIWSFEQLNSDWEAQFHKGEADIDFVPLKNGLFEMKNKGTNTFDSVGFKAHSDRINNGLKLFGKYYRGLWD